MAFGNKKPAAAPAPPPTPDEVAEQHRRAAEDALRRAAKAGRLEAETRLATYGTGRAVLALLHEQKKTNELLAALVEQKGPSAGLSHLPPPPVTA